MPAQNDQTLAILMHVLSIFFGFLSPLLFWLLSHNKQFLVSNSKQALNWQLSLLIYGVIAGLLSLAFIGFILLPLLGILNVIFCVIAAVRASNGEAWQYPLSIRFFTA